MLGRALVVASVLWPMALAGATLDRSRPAPTAAGTAVYQASSLICHQRPERSFTLNGAQWPVCGRCLGLYLAAPVGAVAAWSRRRTRARWPVVAVLAVAASPTVITLAIEWLGVSPLSNTVRALAALPLGAALAAVVVREALTI